MVSLLGTCELCVRANTAMPPVKITFSGRWVEWPKGEAQSPVDQPAGNELPVKSSCHSKAKLPGPLYEE